MVWQDYWTGPEQQRAASAPAAQTGHAQPIPMMSSPAPARRGVPPWMIAAAVVVVAVAVLGLVQRASGRIPGPPEAADRILPMVAVSTAGDFKPVYNRPDGTPVRWSPCKPIHWVYRPTGEPQYGRATVTQAIEALQQATGLQFVYDGDSAEEPTLFRDAEVPELYPGRYAPVLIAWATPEEVARFRGDAIGVALPLVRQGRDGGEEIVSGWAYISTDGPMFTRQGVVLHELSHVLGLDHVNKHGEVMQPFATGMSGLGPGDRAGLAFMGQGPCHGA